MIRRTALVALSAALAAAALSGCSAAPKAADTSSPAQSAPAPAATAQPVQPDPSPGKTADVTELKIEDVKVGTGAEAKAGDLVSVHYTGWLTDGTKFDSSKDAGQPFQFNLGRGEVIAGWDQGVAGMKVGGVRMLTIPPTLGYGSSGAGNGVIPPNATLVFRVELVAVGQ